jgi:hypothetical protein
METNSTGQRVYYNECSKSNYKLLVLQQCVQLQSINVVIYVCVWID